MVAAVDAADCQKPVVVSHDEGLLRRDIGQNVRRQPVYGRAVVLMVIAEPTRWRFGPSGKADLWHHNRRRSFEGEDQLA